MKRILTATLGWILLMALPLGAQSVAPVSSPAGAGGDTHATALKATATAHGITYTWTASTSTYAGLGYNLYVATTSGGEGSTPVNSTLIAPGCSGATCTYTYTNVTAQQTYYATLAACVPNGTGNTCSASTAEVAATIPLAAGDINAPTGFSGSAH